MAVRNKRPWGVKERFPNSEVDCFAFLLIVVTMVRDPATVVMPSRGLAIIYSPLLRRSSMMFPSVISISFIVRSTKHELFSEEIQTYHLMYGVCCF